MHVHVLSPCIFMFSAHASVYRLQQLIDRCCMDCFHAINHAHTSHHVHRMLYTLLLLFLLQNVVHICVYTYTIARMYSVHACACIHSRFSVHASTNSCVLSTSSDRSMLHELFPCAYFTSCAQNAVHSIAVICITKCSTHMR